jgi:hypothetical protein
MFSRWPLFARVLVNLTDGTAIDGLLVEQKGALLVLSDCTVHFAGAEPQNVDGEIYIERDRVLYLQKPRGG